MEGEEHGFGWAWRMNMSRWCSPHKHDFDLRTELIAVSSKIMAFHSNAYPSSRILWEHGLAALPLVSPRSPGLAWCTCMHFVQSVHASWDLDIMTKLNSISDATSCGIQAIFLELYNTVARRRLNIMVVVIYYNCGCADAPGKELCQLPLPPFFSRSPQSLKTR